MVQRIAWDPPKVQIQVRFLVETLALQVYRIARQTTNLQDEVRFLGRALERMSSECDGSARDRAKVVDQVRLLARTLDNLALTPSSASWLRSWPTTAAGSWPRLRRSSCNQDAPGSRGGNRGFCLCFPCGIEAYLPLLPPNENRWERVRRYITPPAIAGVA